MSEKIQYLKTLERCPECGAYAEPEENGSHSVVIYCEECDQRYIITWRIAGGLD